MKRLELVICMLAFSLTIVAQVKKISSTVKACTYFDFMVPSPLTGTPMRANHTLEISYSSKESKYGIDYVLGNRRVMVSCRYDKQLSDGRFRYTGFEINSMRETQIITKVKLEKFLEDYGQEQILDFEDDKKICVEMAYVGPLHIYPLKNTDKLQNSITSQKKAKLKFRQLCKYWELNRKNVEDSIKNLFVEKFISTKGDNRFKYKTINYTVCVDSTQSIRLISIDKFILNDSLYNQYSKYIKANKMKFIDGILIASERQTFRLKIESFETMVTVKNKMFSYDKEIPIIAKDIFEANIRKRGKYAIRGEVLAGKLLLLKSQKIPWAYVTLPKPVLLYSIYE